MQKLACSDALASTQSLPEAILNLAYSSFLYLGYSIVLHNYAFVLSTRSRSTRSERWRSGLNVISIHSGCATVDQWQGSRGRASGGGCMQQTNAMC